MGGSTGILGAVLSKISKCCCLLPCLCISSFGGDDYPEPLGTLTQENINELYSVLRESLSAPLEDMKYTILHRTNNYQREFVTEPPGVIDGKGLTAWLMINLEIFEMQDAQYISNMLNGHEILFSIVNYYMTLAKVGNFRRYPTPKNRYDEKTAMNEYLFACSLFEKIGPDWTNFEVDLTRWNFVYVPYDPETEEQEEEEEEEEDEEVDIELEVEMESDSEDLNAITPWVPTLLAGPSNGMPSSVKSKRRNLPRYSL